MAKKAKKTKAKAKSAKRAKSRTAKKSAGSGLKIKKVIAIENRKSIGLDCLDQRPLLCRHSVQSPESAEVLQPDHRDHRHAWLQHLRHGADRAEVGSAGFENDVIDFAGLPQALVKRSNERRHRVGLGLEMHLALGAQ